jgi:hypothetical protein
MNQSLKYSEIIDENILQDDYNNIDFTIQLNDVETNFLNYNYDVSQQFTGSNVNDFESDKYIKYIYVDTYQNSNGVSSEQREKARRRLERCAKKLENQEMSLQRKIRKLRRARNILMSVKNNDRISVETMHLVKNHFKRRFRL